VSRWAHGLLALSALASIMSGGCAHSATEPPTAVEPLDSYIQEAQHNFTLDWPTWAVDVYTRALAAYPDEACLLALRADAHIQARNYAQARDDADAALRRVDPAPARWHYLRGLASTDDPERAIAELSLALARGPIAPEFHRARADVFSNQLDLEFALFDYRAACAGGDASACPFADTLMEAGIQPLPPPAKHDGAAARVAAATPCDAPLARALELAKTERRELEQHREDFEHQEQAARKFDHAIEATHAACDRAELNSAANHVTDARFIHDRVKPLLTEPSEHRWYQEKLAWAHTRVAGLANEEQDYSAASLHIEQAVRFSDAAPEATRELIFETAGIIFRNLARQRFAACARPYTSAETILALVQDDAIVGIVGRAIQEAAGLSTDVDSRSLATAVLRERLPALDQRLAEVHANGDLDACLLDWKTAP
jgi:tetratricopeptide (TPR) repeat protein